VSRRTRGRRGDGLVREEWDVIRVEVGVWGGKGVKGGERLGKVRDACVVTTIMTPLIMFRNRIYLRVARKQLGDMKSSGHKVVLQSLNIQPRSFDDREVGLSARGINDEGIYEINWRSEEILRRIIMVQCHVGDAASDGYLERRDTTTARYGVLGIHDRDCHWSGVKAGGCKLVKRGVIPLL
jgi:hypothetical protein